MERFTPKDSRFNKETIFSKELATYINPTRLDDEVQRKLIEELTPLTGIGFLRKDIHSQELMNDVAHHILDCDRLSVVRVGGEAIGFTAGSLKSADEKDFYHLEGIIVHPDFQGQGISSTMLKNELNLTAAEYLAFHTQSARMFSLGQKFAELNVDDSIRYAKLIGTRNQDTIIDVGRYNGHSLYENEEEFEKQAIRNINWRNGDALICIGPVKNRRFRTGWMS